MEQRTGITYREEPGKSVSVLLDGRVIGHIYRNAKGYVYAPKGSTLRGDVYPTIAAVKQSLDPARATHP